MQNYYYCPMTGKSCYHCYKTRNYFPSCRDWCEIREINNKIENLTNDINYYEATINKIKKYQGDK